MQGKKTHSCLKANGFWSCAFDLLIAGALESKRQGKATKAQGFGLLVLPFAEVPKKFCCSHACKLCEPAHQGCHWW